MGIIGIEALDTSGIGSCFYNRLFCSLMEPNLAAVNRHAMQFYYGVEELRHYQHRPKHNRGVQHTQSPSECIQLMYNPDNQNQNACSPNAMQ